MGPTDWLHDLVAFDLLASEVLVALLLLVFHSILKLNS